VLGKPVPIIPEDQREEFDELSFSVLQGHTFSDRELVRCHKDGTRMEISASGAPLLDEAGQVTGGLMMAVSLSDRRRAEELIRHAKERFELLVNSVEGIVWEAEPGPQFTFVSRQAQRLLGYPPEAWLDRPGFWEEHLHPADREWAMRYTREQQQAGKPHQLEYRMIAADGRAVWLRDIVSVSPASGPRSMALHGVMVDITDSKLLEDERNRLLVGEREARAAAEDAERHVAFLAEASRLLATSLDYEATLERVAQLALPMLADYCIVDLVDDKGALQRVAVAHVDPRKALLAKELKDRYPLDPRWPEGIAKVLRSGQADIIPQIPDAYLQSIARDAEHLRLLRELGSKSAVAAPLIARGRKLGIITLLYGDSGRRYKAADRTLVEDLASRAALAVDNARLYREAQEAIRARDEFLSIASHELRTPCTSLQLGVQSMLRFAHQGSMERAPAHLVQSVLETAERQSKRLSSLVDKLLDVSRITAGKLQLDLEPVDLTALCREVAAAFQADLAASGSTLAVDLQAGLVGNWDRARVSQVLTNLVSNAIKYGDGKPIRLRAWREGEQALVEIEDHGIGVPPERRAQIFERFERAVSAKHYGGLGLGLYIVRQITGALGGDIQLVSETGKGSTFTVRLPVAGPQPSGEGPSPGAQPNA
jgi:PAS domain S-box-containing protein